jgi:outer membrane lipoprotein-sorting protein
MRTLLSSAIAGLLLAVAHAPSVAQDRGLAVLQAASRKYPVGTSLCSDFTQHLSVPLLREEHTTSGRLCEVPPDRFGMRFTDPVGGVYLINGESVWYYMPSTDDKQAFHIPLAQDTGGRDFRREFLENPESKYVVTYETSEDLGGVTMDRVRLVPRSKASYRAAVLWIEQQTSILRQIKIEEENENERTLTLRAVDFGAKPPDGFFEFAVPAGVLVITR